MKWQQGPNKAVLTTLPAKIREKLFGDRRSTHRTGVRPVRGPRAHIIAQAYAVKPYGSRQVGTHPHTLPTLTDRACRTRHQQHQASTALIQRGQLSASTAHRMSIQHFW